MYHEKTDIYHYRFNIIIGGCSTVHKEAKHSSQSIPEEVPASQYKGQGFQPVAEKVLSHMRKIS